MKEEKKSISGLENQKVNTDKVTGGGKERLTTTLEESSLHASDKLRESITSDDSKPKIKLTREQNRTDGSRK